jgi:hypothetical protein
MDRTSNEIIPQAAERLVTRPTNCRWVCFWEKPSRHPWITYIICNVVLTG